MTNASQPAVGRGVSPGARMQSVIADLQEGQGDQHVRSDIGVM